MNTKKRSGIPVAALDELGAAPLAVRLLERDVVLWRHWPKRRAMRGPIRCPHRGHAPLAGRIVEGRLECGYHGWRFNAGGQCVAIPALPDSTPPASHAACAYDVRFA